MTTDDACPDDEVDSPNSSGPPHGDEQLLAEFLKDRDVKCPTCGYNLRNLTSSACPECETKIDLRVGEREIRLGWFALTIAPGAFSGVLTLLLMLVGTLAEGNPFIAGPVIFSGLVSAAIATAIIASGDSFVRQPAAKQAGAAAIVWAVHVVLFIMLVFVAFAI